MAGAVEERRSRETVLVKDMKRSRNELAECLTKWMILFFTMTMGYWAGAVETTAQPWERLVKDISGSGTTRRAPYNVTEGHVHGR
jgi:hypothetical protein